MRIVCLEHFEMVSTGFLGMGAKQQKRIEGLTIGKSYTGQTVMMIEGGGNISVDCYPKFLVYNDNNQWEMYETDLFKPEVI